MNNEATFDNGLQLMVTGIKMNGMHYDGHQRYRMYFPAQRHYTHMLDCLRAFVNEKATIDDAFECYIRTSLLMGINKFSYDLTVLTGYTRHANITPADQPIMTTVYEYDYEYYNRVSFYMSFPERIIIDGNCDRIMNQSLLIDDFITQAMFPRLKLTISDLHIED